MVAVTGTEIRPIYLRTGTFGSYQYIESAYTESVPVGYEIATGEAVEWYVNITGLSGVWYAYNVEPKQLVYLRNYGSNPALQGYAYFGSGSVVQPIQPKNWYRASVPPSSFLDNDRAVTPPRLMLFLEGNFDKIVYNGSTSKNSDFYWEIKCQTSGFVIDLDGLWIDGWGNARDYWQIRLNVPFGHQFYGQGILPFISQGEVATISLKPKPPGKTFIWTSTQSSYYN